MMTLEELLSEIEYMSHGINVGVEVTYLSRDSRDILGNGVPIFFAMKGKHSDALIFADSVLKKNKNSIIVSSRKHPYSGVWVDDLELCMALVARRFYDYPDRAMKVIAVTGTNGKSTIVFLLRHLLKHSGKTGIFGSIEYDLGGRVIAAKNTTPFALDFYKMLGECRDNGCNNVVLEASSHALDQKRIYALDVNVAIFTNLTREHMDYHGTFKNYFSVKSKLFDGSNGSKPKYSLVNLDDEYGERLVENLEKNGQAVFTFGMHRNADFRILDVQKSTFEGSTFTLKHNAIAYVFETELFGDYNISNITAALGAAYLMGCNFNELRLALPGFSGAPGRLEKVSLKNGATVFIDYAHTPDAFEKVMGALRRQTKGKLIPVFGCGGDRDRTKRAPATKIMTKLSDYAFATVDNPRTEPIEQIFADMKKGAAMSTSIEFISDRRLAIESAMKFSNEGDVIIITGRGREKFQQVGETFIPFDDREVVEEISAKLW